jgi:alanine racemase
MLKDRGLRIPLRHIDNSAGVIGYGSHYEMVRAGIVLYGLYPSDEVDREKLPLTPAMSWHTTVSCVKLLESGRKISYGGTYETTKPTLVATIPAGYADGYRRSLSGKFYVLIRGRKAPILGRICMDQFMVDVTDIPGVQAGDPVVLMGRSGEEQITVEALSQAADSFCYEQICDISRRVTRVYTKGGQETGRVNYLLEK